eukprot:2023735-Pleurochrysis_carterae.AAC.1
MEEYHRQGVGYIEVKGVPMIFYITLMDGEKFHFNTNPSDRPFTITVGIRIWRQNEKRMSYWDPMHKKTFPEDRPSFEEGMSHGQAIVDIYKQMDRMAYMWWRYANVSVNSLVNRQFVNINWTPGAPAPAPKNRPPLNVPWPNRPLRAGVPVIDDSLAAAQPEHCVPAAFEETDDG